MNDLKDQFLQRSITGLRDLAARVSQPGNSGTVEKGLSGEAFRLLHTIKGTAQTFGLAAAAKLAHEIEGHLSASNEITGELLVLGISHLIRLLEAGDAESPDDFSTKLRAGETLKTQALLISRITRETFRQFSDIEKGRLFSACGNGLEIYCLDAAFGLADFTTGFKALKERLDERCETIATLPGGNEPGKIAFRFYAAAGEDPGIEEIARELGGGLERLSIAPGAGLFEVLAQIGKHGLDLARDFGKEVNIVISLRDVDEVPMEAAKIVFDTLLHLVRNAIDHAFISKGTIFIAVCIKDAGLLVRVEDDGAGLDPERIKSKAVERGLIGPDETLAPDEIIGLIFSPGFSTAESVSEISGRGVGLDAVKSLVEDSSGTISVKSEKGKGTVFEVFLPILLDSRKEIELT
jgi:chemotaxis protein histidine kinase CheA